MHANKTLIGIIEKWNSFVDFEDSWFSVYAWKCDQKEENSSFL